MLHSPQSLVPSSTGTTFPEPEGPEAGRAWCLTPRNPLFLRRRAPRFPSRRGTRRARRGASLPTIPCSFVTGHHVPGTSRTAGGPGVVPPSPQSFVSSSSGTTFPEPEGPEAGPAWCRPPRNPFCLRRRAPRLSSIRGPRPECPTARREKKQAAPGPLWLPPSPRIGKYPPLHSSRRVFPSLFSWPPPL